MWYWNRENLLLESEKLDVSIFFINDIHLLFKLFTIVFPASRLPSMQNEKWRGNWLCLIFNMEVVVGDPSVKVLSNTSNPLNQAKLQLWLKRETSPQLRSCFQKASRHIWAATALLWIPLPHSPLRLLSLEYGDDINTNRNIARDRYRLCRFEL